MIMYDYVWLCKACIQILQDAGSVDHLAVRRHMHEGSLTASPSRDEESLTASPSRDVRSVMLRDLMDDT